MNKLLTNPEVISNKILRALYPTGELTREEIVTVIQVDIGIRTLCVQLQERGLVHNRCGNYSLTDQGREYVKELKPTKAEDMESARKCGLSLIHYRILLAISKARYGLTYRQIEEKTGYYSILTGRLKEDHEGSLGYMKLVEEEQHEGERVKFLITDAGRKRLAKAN